MDESKRSEDWWSITGEFAPIVVVIGLVLGGGASLSSSLLPRQSIPSAIVVEGGAMKIDGENISVTTSEFTPRGSFKIGKPFFDPTIGSIAYPFKTTDWRYMDDRNELKRTIEKREKETGKKMSVAYAIHAGNTSQGCVTMPKNVLKQIEHKLEGRTIKIK